MGLLTFKGGIHPDDGKKLSKDKPIVEAKPGKELVYPLSQHIGAPANPIVEIGARVLRGEKIAEAGGFVSVGNGQGDRSTFYIYGCKSEQYHN